jgi:hypothetical protein
MRGSTRKRGATWTALWSVIDPATCERQQTSTGGFRTRKDAERHLATVVTHLSDGAYIAPSREPFGRYLLDEWLPAITATVRPATPPPTGRWSATPSAPKSARCRCARHRQHLNRLHTETEQAGLSVHTRGLTHAALHRALRDAVR